MTATQTRTLKRQPNRQPKATPADYGSITQPDESEVEAAKLAYIAAPDGAQKAAARDAMQRIRAAHLETRRGVYLELIRLTDAELVRVRCELSSVYAPVMRSKDFAARDGPRNGGK